MTASLLALLAVAASGTISGRVVHSAPAPAPEVLPVHVNEDVCGRAPVRSESLSVGPDGGLANVVVALVDAPQASSRPPVVKLEQEGCVFAPHVQSTVVGATLDIGNSDPVIHNVHGRLDDRTVFNLAMPIPGLRVKRTLDAPGVVSIVCDSGHTWMSAYVVVVPHPHHATTGLDGRFALPDVPPGEYRVRAWHEKLGERLATIEVVAGREVTLDFDFSRAAEEVATEPPPTVATATVAPVGLDRAALAALAGGLYFRHCATCHGDAGDGQGASAHFLDVAPRDFRLGVYKFRSTPSGRLPTEDDVFRSISLGLPGTEMPGFRRRLSVADRRMLARYVMSFSSRFVRERAGTPIAIPKAPSATPASVAAGRETYVRLQCAQCHGVDAVLDTAESADMTDDWGRVVRATDLLSGTFKGGDTPRAVFRTLSTGLDGSPMPSFAEVLPPEERWALVHYLMDLRAR